jgi:hypothetical protein
MDNIKGQTKNAIYEKKENFKNNNNNNNKNQQYTEKEKEKKLTTLSLVKQL